MLLWGEEAASECAKWEDVAVRLWELLYGIQLAPLGMCQLALEMELTRDKDEMCLPYNAHAMEGEAKSKQK
jgi:hypothetical protein